MNESVDGGYRTHGWCWGMMCLPRMSPVDEWRSGYGEDIYSRYFLRNITFISCLVVSLTEMINNKNILKNKTISGFTVEAQTSDLLIKKLLILNDQKHHPSCLKNIY